MLNEDYNEYGNLINRYQVGAMIDAHSINDYKNAKQYAIDAIVVRGMVKALDFYDSFGEDSGLTQDDVNKAKYIINEFDSAQYVDLSSYIYSSGDTLGQGQVATGYIPDTITYRFTATSNGQTIWTMPFDISQVHDVDAISLTLNGMADPSYSNDYTIVGNLFTWSGLTVSTGWVFEIKYNI